MTQKVLGLSTMLMWSIAIAWSLPFIGFASAVVFDDFYFSTQPADMVVERGRPATLHCLAKHIREEPKIRWIRDNEYIVFGADSRRHLLTNGSLYFEQIMHTRSERPDEGIYQCEATVKGQSTILSRAAKVQVAYLRPFESEPRSLILRLDDAAMFACDIDGLPKPAITWFKNDRPLSEADSINIKVHPGGMLEISRIQFSDFANYKCLAQNTERSRTSEAASLTQNPVVPTEGGSNPNFVMEPSDVTAIAGDSIMLYCGANGRDQDGRPPSITWLKDGVTIDMSNLDSRFRMVGQGSLLVENVHHDDTATYTCRAANLDESVDAQAKLQVHVPPKFITQPSNTAANPNEDVQLACDVTGYPKPQVTWMKNGDIIIPNDYFQLVNAHDLKILGLVSSDEGVYQCMVTNEAGNTQAVAQLKILTPGSTSASEAELPTEPLRLRSIITSTRFVTLAWDVPNFTGPSEIISYSVYWKESGSNRERLMNTSNQEVNIQHLKPASLYEFRVLAYNRFGPGKEYAMLNLTTKPEVDVPAPVTNVELTVVSPTSIIVQWQPPVETLVDITSYKVYYLEHPVGKEREMQVSGTSCTLVDLSVYTEYSIRVVAFNSNGRGISSKEVYARTFSATPSATPQNVTLEPVSSSSIIVRWEPPTDGTVNGIITGYKLRYKKSLRREGSRSSTITTDGNIRFYALTDLDRATRYQFRIAAMNVNGTGPATKWMTVNTFMSDLDETAVPGQPSSLRVRPFSTAIDVSWTPPLDQDVKVRGYTLGYGIGIPDIYSQVLDSKRRLYTIEDLKPSSEYVISLRAYNKVGDGRPIYETVITREESAPEPMTPMIPPVGLRAIVLSPMTVLVRWTDTTLGRNQHINDKRFYTVRYAPKGLTKGMRRFRNLNASDLNAHINDLRPHTEYEFAVKVVKGRRKSAWSMSVFNTTLEAAPFSAPRDLTPVPVEELPFGVTLNWQPPRLPNGQITGYLVFYTTDPTLKDREWAVEGVLGHRLSSTIRELKPDKDYYFKIQARNSKGFGPMSAPITYRTASENTAPNLLWIILACVAGLTLVAILTIVAVYVKRKNNNNQNLAARGTYKPSSKGGNFTPNEIKPPDLWIHHDQMELKSISNSDTPMTMTPIPPEMKGEDMADLQQRNSFIIDNSSYDRRTSQDARARLDEEAGRYRRPLRSKPISFPVGEMQHRDPIATAIIPNGHLADLAAPIPIRPVYPRTQYNTQYGSTGITGALSGALTGGVVSTRIPPAMASDLSSQPGSDYMTQSDDQTSVGTSTYDRRSLKHHRSRDSLNTGPQSPDSTYNSAPIPYDQLSNASSSGASTPLPDFSKSLQRSNHPLKSFNMPAPPSVPGTPSSKHIVKPLVSSSSPYKKTTSPSPTNTNNSPLKSKSPHPVVGPKAPPDVIVKAGKEDDGKSCSTEELSAEMASLEGLMKDLTAMTTKEFQC